MRELTILLFGLAVLGAPAARAADAPSLTGTWTGRGPSANKVDGLQSDQHTTLVITEQQGSIFKGRIEYPDGSPPGKEENFGVVRADGRTILIADDDGIAFAILMSPDSMEYCYLEPGDEGIANCRILTRSK